jgi:hypothetical protein
MTGSTTLTLTLDGAAAASMRGAGLLRSRACQIAGVALACALVAAVNWGGDGLWFQGDSPRHAMNGLFLWDFITLRPHDPIAFAARYYARYPVIAPATYPPLFYLLEGVGFAIFGPSPRVAKTIVLLFAGLAGAYTTAWARRWQNPAAGWAGPFLVFVPGMVVWSNTVMLNVPATALGLGVLYHFRRWTEDARVGQLAWTTMCVAALGLTYYPGLAALAVCAAWAIFLRRAMRFDRWSVALSTVTLVSLVPLVASLLLIPVHTTRQWPTLGYLMRGTTWTFYWARLPEVAGDLGFMLGVTGAIAGLLGVRSRTEATYLTIWIAALMLAVSLLPAKDPRYILLAAPALVLAAALGVARAAESLPALRPAWHAPALIVALVLAGWSASRVAVPRVSGFRELALFLRDEAAADAVLYDGGHDGVFGFYLRALDPRFERRMVRSDKLLFQYGPTTTFNWVETSNVSTPQDVVGLLRARGGCRWVAIEISPRPPGATARLLLRDAVALPEFQLVRSFPIAGAGERRVDLYRLIGDVDADATQELTFPAFSDRVFRDVVPITR